MKVGRRAVWIPALLALGISAGCAEVDRDRYVVGDPGTTRFTNVLRETVYLGGCSVFDYQKFEGKGWTDRGPGVVCIWEGFARPIHAQESLESPFTAPDEEGLWRLRYPLGLGCAEDAPLSEENCAWLDAVPTRPFEVVGLCAVEECGPPLGMPNRLCPDGSWAGPTGRCLHDPETGSCGWEVLSCP